MTITDAQFVKNGEAVAVASENTNERDLSQLSLKELIEAMILACDKEIASKYETENA